MKSLSTSQMQHIDRILVERYGIPVFLLMDHAGRAVAEAARDLARGRTVIVLAGGGNNGGDGVAAARYLKGWGYRVDVWWLKDPTLWKGSLALHYAMAKRMGVRFKSFEKLPSSKRSQLRLASVVIDALLGTGTHGEVRATYAEAIRSINDSHRPVIAVDIPSGMDSDSGKSLGVCVKAHVTVTMGAAKTGLLKPIARSYIGQLVVADIGIPRMLLS